MLKRLCSGIALVGFALLVTGCDGQKGSAFVGHWDGLDKENPMSLDIKYDDGVYHIDHKYKLMFMDEAKENKFEATAMSDDVLTIDKGVLKLTLRLEGDQIHFEREQYSKAK